MADLLMLSQSFSMAPFSGSPPPVPLVEVLLAALSLAIETFPEFWVPVNKGELELGGECIDLLES